MRRRRRPALPALLALLGLVGCGNGSERAAPGVYAARGVVEEVLPAYRQVVIDHEDIPGLMPAMAMNFDVADPALLERLAPGQEIAFQLEFTGRSYRILEAEVIGIADRPGARLGIARATKEREPAPAFTLVDQDGQTVSLGDLRGKTLLLDFVFTRCPGPCPILTGLHVRVQRALTPEVRERVHFLSISVDPETDTPALLRSYAEAHGADLSGWSFLTGKPEAVSEVLGRYGIGRTRDAEGQITHVVATFLIDAEGTIVKRYLGLDHASEDMARDLARLAAGAEPAPAEAGGSPPVPSPPRAASSSAG